METSWGMARVRLSGTSAAPTCAAESFVADRSASMEPSHHRVAGIALQSGLGGYHGRDQRTAIADAIPDLAADLGPLEVP